MELLVILSSLCICLSLLVKPCASSAQEILAIQEQSSTELAAAASKGILFAQPTLPRKLRILQEPVKDSGVQGSTSYNEQMTADASGKPYKRQQHAMAGIGARGTWKEWVERADKSEYFTMDYTPVKRRRPIHNKSLPVGP